MRAKDSNQGKVELFNEAGGRIRHAVYHQVSARKQLVEEWLRELPSWKQYRLVITPAVELPRHELDQIEREWKWKTLKASARKWAGEVDGEKHSLHPVAGNSPEACVEAPSCHDLPTAVGLDRAAQIDAKIESLEKVA